MALKNSKLNKILQTGYIHLLGNIATYFTQYFLRYISTHSELNVKQRHIYCQIHVFSWTVINMLVI